MNILLPVLGIMSVTSEWSQRTAMVTFTLEPSRSRFLAAKFVGTLIVAVVAVVIGLALTIARQRPLRGVLRQPGDLGARRRSRSSCYFLLYVFAMSTGFAFGALLLSTAGGDRRLLRLLVHPPQPVRAGATLLDWFKDIRPWVDFASAQNPIIEADVSGKEWAQLAVSGLIWLGLPLAIGIWRVLRAEVK